KFEAKGDEGYFIGYSMSSKAFRVFNKRTRRVEENLHVEFLENKAIEKGAGPNWLFDIDSLTKSMNYVPMIVADQLETLTVETPIPTVSLPVPTACLNNSLEPLSDTRLISTRVANQVETPSLDNILTLTNRFEDIIRVTTNSVDSDGLEADVTNIETNITASPTPTLTIHKDHHKKPKKIFDVLQDPSWVEAMQEELLQFKLQKVWTLVDCPKGIRPIGTKWVLKNKKDERGIVIRNKARLVAQGHTHEERIDYDEVFAPVARIEAIRLFLAYASFMGFTVYQMDVKSAFLYGELNFFLGLQVLQKEDGIFLSQDKYVGDILKKFRYSDVRSSNTPMDKENPWGKDKTGKDVDLHIYRSMIGSLMYLTTSRPDIMFAVCACDKHQVTPKECHLHAVKRIFRYLKGHSKLGLWCPKESPFDLVAYSDSDYGGATQDRKSTARGCQFFGRRDCFEKKRISVDHIHTDENVADLLTKPFDAGRFQYLVSFFHCYVSTVSVFLGFGLTFAGTSKYWGVLRILMISLRLIPLSTARIETTKKETKILATVDGILRTVTESSLSRNLKLQDEEGINSLPDAELFENLTLMGYNISPNQKFTFQKGFNEFSSNIANALVCLATNRTYNFSKMIFDGMVKNVNNKIAQSLALPPVADEPASPLRDVSKAPRVTSPAADEGSMQQTVNELTALCTSLVKLLEDREGVVAERSRDDAPIKGMNLDEGEAAAERVIDDTEEMETVLTSMDAATVLSGGVVEVSTGSGSIPTAGPPAAEVPTGSDVVPTAGIIFATTTVVSPFPRRKGKETMVESETPKKKKIQEQIDIQMARQLEEEMERDAQRMNESNEIVAKYLQEYHQFATVLPLERQIELISDRIKYQDNYAKVHKFQTQQRKPWSKKQKRDSYMAVIKSILGWKVKDFRGMTFKEIEAKFTTVWKQLEDFIPIGSKEEAKRFKRKGIRFEKESVKKLKTSEEVPEEVKKPDEVLEEKVKEMMQMVPIEEVYVEALQVKHHIIDWKGRFEPVMGLIEGVSQHQNLMHASVEWKLYDTCRVHHVTSKRNIHACGEGLPPQERFGNYDDLLQALSEELLSDGK
nr:hypothetical protein [Tanacetum cinerariifolium]